MNDNPWPTAADRLNKHVRWDTRLATHLNELSEDQSSEVKLAHAIEHGRCYGLQQQYYQMVLRRQLNREKVEVQGPW